jgi:hypothetical protein
MPTARRSSARCWRDDRRPQDAADLRALLTTADRDEVARARESANLIVDRGFGRNRDLPGDLEQFLSRLDNVLSPAGRQDGGARRPNSFRNEF